MEPNQRCQSSRFLCVGGDVPRGTGSVPVFGNNSTTVYSNMYLVSEELMAR